ncbi:MAG TPA: excinuclease ABC subunit UvrC [Bacteroidales bacterium]|jgi:excinuclease ABC subunit C|nr:excinuclease ABC subunit UvrC [Bacteroidales bacterium]HQH23168.1 excinuclease ABC subunit UvrC [Bacteroidales bacterium]HQJ80974.1 excinuclease ABC subunit UvrC [Bacteroidales bacterium]
MTLIPQDIVPLLPDKPGVYQFLDSSGRIIYAGKAKNLKKRVSSYFSKNQSGKTRVMLARAAGLNHIVVDNESEALLLENNIIKQHQPRYNIQLKDDKTFPWICIRNEPFPRIFSTRNTVKDGSLYYGPYTSALMVKTLLELIRNIYKIRTCSLNLSRENIAAGRFRVCLEYHLGNCRAPCVGLQDEEDYSENVRQIKEILKGNISTVIDHLKSLMMGYAAELRFEEAQAVKNKIDILSKFRSRSTVVSTTIRNVDVFAMTQDTDRAYINYLKVIKGAVIQAYTLEIRSRVDEEKESLLGFAVTEIRQRLSSDSPEIIVPFKPDILFENIKYTVPKKGDKQKLLELAGRNALYYKLEQRKKKEIIPRGDRTLKNLEKLRNDLNMSEMPLHIECFDNSSIMGQNPVAACVVFRNGRPSKKEYRHFNVKTVTGQDDYSTMEEIVWRRYKRITGEGKPMPQLIVIDGGKGQLSSAMKSLRKLNVGDGTTVIGIAEKLEEIYFPGDSVPIYLDKTSVSLKIIQQVRNEAHRFGITFHRNKRSGDLTKSSLDSIPGIGIRTKEILLKKAGSVDKIRKLSEEELEKLVGRKKAEILRNFLKESP